MNISEQTIQVLKNFASINQSILFKEGSIISTLSPSSDILGQYRCPETWPVEFAIYDLNKFLAVLGTFKSPTLAFKPDSLQITETNDPSAHKIRYMFCDPLLIKQSPYREIPFETAAKFKLDINNFIRICLTMKMTHIGITICDEVEEVRGFDSTNTDETTQKLKMINSGSDDIEMDFAIERFKILRQDYVLSVPKKQNLLHLATEDNTLQYWIAAEPKN